MQSDIERKVKIFKIRVLIAAAVIVALAGLLITFYNYRLTDIASQAQKESALEIFTGRILTEITHLEVTLETTIEIMNNEHIAIAKAIDYILEGASESELTSQALQRLATPLDIIELNIADSNGILTHSNVPELIGFNYNDYDETRIYITLATETLSEIRELPRQSVLDGHEFGATNHYAGISRTGGGFIQLGFDAEVIWKLYDEFDTAQAVRNIEIGENGYGMVTLDSTIIAHPSSAMLGVDVADEPWYAAINSGHGFTWLEIDGARYYAGYTNENNHTVVGLIPEDEFFKERSDILSRSLTLVFISVSVIIPVVYMLTSMFIRTIRHSGKEE